MTANDPLRLIRFFRRFLRLRVIALSLALLATAPLPLPHLHPAKADPNQPEDPFPETGRNSDTEEGFSLLEEGARLMLRGLMNEMEPSFSEMEKAFREMAPEIGALGPRLQEIARLMQDVQNYDMPVMLENGDILIRRKILPPVDEGQEMPDPALPDAPPAVRPWPPEPGPNGEIDL